MLDTLNWLNVRQIISYNVLVFIFKMKLNMIPEYLMKNVSFVKNRTSRLLRNQNDFDIKRKNKLSN